MNVARSGFDRTWRATVEVLQRSKPASVPCRDRPSVSDSPMKRIQSQGIRRSPMKFARNVHFQIKSGKETEFTTLFEKEVVPMLRKQNGFQEEVTLLNPRGAEFISLWDNKKSAET